MRRKRSLLSHTIIRLLALGLLSTGVMMPTLSHAANAASIFYVPLNRSELLTTSTDMTEVIITDPEVANVVVHGKRKISIIGLQIGQTTLRIFDANHKLLRSMDVSVTYDLPALRRALKQFLPNERIGVNMINTRMALTGEISSAAAAASAIEIAEEFVHAKLSNQAAENRTARSGANASPVINMMTISSGQQVMLRIRIGEVQRSALKNLGVNLTAFNGAGGGFTIGTGTGQFGNRTGTNPSFSPNTFFGTTGGDSFGSIGASGRVGSLNLASNIDALEQNGLFKVLAEPNLTALSGEEAQFLAGGEFPVPVPGGSVGATTIEYKQFGVALKFTPFVISQNRLRIQVMPEVSEISTDNSFTTTDGFTVPSINTRRASTTVELAPGESFMLAGLMRDEVRSTIRQLPGVGDVPVLGALFRSTAYQRSETELVIAVTPYLVDPVKGSDIKLPSDDFRPASFMESIFFGALSANRGGKDPSLEGPTGFMTDN